jgi:hypothetical protein
VSEGQRRLQPDSDGDEDDPDDRRALLFHRVRRMIRRTPWLQDVCRPSVFAPMTADARAMFG